MGEPRKPTLRIDWFDGTVVEDNGQNSMSNFADEDVPEPEPMHRVEKAEIERKPIGFKRLLDLSLLRPPELNLEIANRPGFWHLFDAELKGDFIVLIVKILANVYHSLQPGDKGKIVTMLRTKFEKSTFLKVLSDYLTKLPEVRIAEKRLNFQLWNDVDAFYMDVSKLCKSIFEFGIHSLEYLQDLFTLIEVAENSAIGVENEHSETINIQFYNTMKDLKLEVLNSIQIASNSSKETTHTKSSDPSYFRNLNIYPTRQDLLGNGAINIKPNIINGAYPSVEEYLDLQFKLLREDYFAPLREGMSRYWKGNSLQHESTRFYSKVKVMRHCVSNNKIGYLVDIAYGERYSNITIDKTRYALNKQLMFGSLLIFYENTYDSMYFATVLDSNTRLLREGYIAVTFTNPVPSEIFSRTYAMLESDVFFEPYHRVLKVLQNCGPDLPMKEYIVDVQPKKAPPSYLSSQTIYSANDSKTSEEFYFPVLETVQWPPADRFGLDDSQMEAYTLALTREFAVIQGPPGTGKTFIGTKIASTLLKNLSLEGTPMLIICYTNHALDQFLESILKVTTNVIRLGSQSKNKAIEQYSLNNMRMKSNSKYSHLFVKKRKELERLSKEMTELQSEIEKCERDLLSYKTIEPYLKVGDKILKLKSDKEDPVVDWIFNHLDDKQTQTANSPEKIKWMLRTEDTDFHLIPINDKLEVCFSEDYARKEIDSLKNSLKYVKDITDNDVEQETLKNKFEIQIKKIQNRLEYFKENMIHVNPNDNTVKVDSLYDLPPRCRFQLYINTAYRVREKLMGKMNVLMERHNALSGEIDEVKTVIDGDVMKAARVVGATTAVAARRHDLLKQLHSPIVIVEEAAEVFEAHIIASLTSSCKHLILIGDHKQLRPTAAHYKLAKQYNLEISLFERMIRNGIHSRTLHVQRRMRPNFVELLVPAIYDKLECHPSVLSYTDVKGMLDNLFFFNHTVFEETVDREDSWSHRNAYEAMWCVSLANYLRHVNYDADDIVILSTYTAQATLIRQLSQKYPFLHDVKITVVDNYQGEESKIVILSLVRSNKDGRIGFLSAENRICVALSRAKEGFYIFGNMTILQAASPIWRSINQKLIAQNAIGSRFRLQCEHHRKTIYINNPEALDDCIAGECFRICNEEFNRMLCLSRRANITKDESLKLYKQMSQRLKKIN